MPKRTRRDGIKALGGMLLGGSIAGCLGGGDSEEIVTVEIQQSLQFSPQSVTIAPGTTVRWENTTGINHSVTAVEDELPDGAEYFASGGFESESAARDAYPDQGVVDSEEPYEHTFETVGEYEYLCLEHDFASGEVVVEEE